MPLAPYAVIVTPVNINEPDVMKAAGEIYEELLAADVEVILDDRDERAGVKFKDADLIGIPLRLTVSKRSAQEGIVEARWRAQSERLKLDSEGLERELGRLLDRERC